jgi:heme-degrading monooxygenase HmoA
MYYLVWSYEVDSSKQAKFEEEYSRNGPWFKFYEPCRDYLGHELIRNMQSSNYLLIDKWMNKEAYEHFVKSNLLEYDALNRQSRDLYENEVQLGSYMAI